MSAEMQDSTKDVIALVRRYYAALEDGAPLSGFYARDEEAAALGPVVKVGSGKDEEFTGYAIVKRAVDEVTASFGRNRLQSRALLVRRQGSIAWFSDFVWWSGEQAAQPFASLTRWTGVCLLTSDGWKFLQVHVSEGV
jgi:hypothetical protein